MKYFPITTRMAMNRILSVSDYKPQYTEREGEECPHCGEYNFVRTNRYLFRCRNYKHCGRYF